MYGVGDDAPDGEVVVGCDLYLREVWVVRYEPCAVAVLVALELFDGVFAVDVCHDEVPVARCEAAVDDDEVAIKYTGITHRVAIDMSVESGVGIGCKFADKVDALACMVGSGRREACVDRLGELECEVGGFVGLCEVG